MNDRDLTIYNYLSFGNLPSITITRGSKDNLGCISSRENHYFPEIYSNLLGTWVGSRSATIMALMPSAAWPPKVLVQTCVTFCRHHLLAKGRCAYDAGHSQTYSGLCPSSPTALALGDCNGTFCHRSVTLKLEVRG